MEFPRTRYINQLKNYEGNSLIKVITGVRRCGKSYLLNQLFYRTLLSQGVKEDHIIRFAFDNDEDLDKIDAFFPNEETKIRQGKNLYTVNSKKFRAYIASITNDSDPFFLLLDEIQLLDSFSGTLNGFLHHSNFDVYVTGSNSQMLSSEVETTFRGRKSSIHVLPLTFKELVEGLSLTPSEAWRQYILTGGMPIIYRQKEEKEREDMLVSLCDEIYLKDIKDRKGVRNMNVLSDLFDVLSSNVGNGVSPSKLEDIFRSNKHVQATDDTIDQYIDYLQDSFLVSKAKKYNIKGNAYINTPYKVYFEDIGVRNARLLFKQIEEGHLMENIVYNELRYRGYFVDVGEINVNEMTDRKDKNGKNIYKESSLEVDFIAYRNMERYYIQVCLNMDEEKTRAREKKSLYYINDSFKKIIVVKDGLPPRVDENGFLIIDVFDFLLDENSLKR